MWDKLLKHISKNEYAKINKPCSTAKIKSVEKQLGIQFPESLVSLLLTIDGDGWFLMSASEIFEDNKSLRKLDCYMPLDSLMFFARNGCGDYYGFPIIKGEIKPDNIYFWDHGLDSRTWCESSLENLIDKYCDGKI